MSNKESVIIPENKKQDFKEAKKSLKKIMEDISPFIKKRIIKHQSTIGKWSDTSNLYREDYTC